MIVGYATQVVGAGLLKRERDRKCNAEKNKLREGSWYLSRA